MWPIWQQFTKLLLIQHFINLQLLRPPAAHCTEPHYFTLYTRSRTRNKREISTPSTHNPLLMTMSFTFSTQLRPPTFYSQFSVPVIQLARLLLLAVFNDFSCHTGRQTKRVGEIGVIKALQSSFAPRQMQLDASSRCERLAPRSVGVSIFLQKKSIEWWWKRLCGFKSRQPLIVFSLSPFSGFSYT